MVNDPDDYSFSRVTLKDEFFWLNPDFPKELVHYVSPPAGALKYYLLLHTHGLTPVANNVSPAARATDM
ncbi:MAG: hypothetical protein P9M08_07075, partial [Candidatus Erginobacter occultus]|nr:hypothetical protein [Candidatus Erginobacter occultus]